MYYLSADFSGWYYLKGKSRKTFDIVVFKKSKSRFLKFRFTGLQPGSLSPPYCVPLLSTVVQCYSSVPQFVTVGTYTHS